MEWNEGNRYGNEAGQRKGGKRKAGENEERERDTVQKNLKRKTEARNNDMNTLGEPKTEEERRERRGGIAREV